MPGTHHIRFQVDGQVTTAEDLPTAVDDNGTIANYVAVPLSGNTPPSASAAALAHPTPTKENPNNHLPPAISTAVGASFFADAQANANEDAAWTDRTPWQLECAAEEEESWLTHGQQAHSQPPQHPQAPSLPRHLEKLIMNQKMPSGTGSARAGAGVGGSRAGPGGGVSNNNRSGGGATSGVGSVVGGQLPVVTASGTNLSAGTSGGGKGTSSNNTAGVANFTTKEMYTKLVDAAGLADDGSVLPVPSHVVLHHLGTSAIRNGVLAVADTMRYKKKVSSEFEFLPSSPPPWDSFPVFLTWNRVLLTFDSCGLLCSTLRRFITSQHDVGARRDFVFSSFPVSNSNSLAKNRLSSYIYGPLRPPNDPDPHARTHTMHNAHHIHDLSPPRLAIGPPRPKPARVLRFIFFLC